MMTARRHSSFGNFPFKKSPLDPSMGLAGRLPFSVSMTVTRMNRSELSDMIVAAAVSGASSLQIGAVMPEGRARNRLDLTLSREEWAELKAEIQKRDYGIPYTFCDEMICECRDQPSEFLARFHNPDFTPCQAGKVFR